MSSETVRFFLWKPATDQIDLVPLAHAEMSKPAQDPCSDLKAVLLIGTDRFLMNGVLMNRVLMKLTLNILFKRGSVALLFAAMLAGVNAHAGEAGPQQQIRALISASYDRPGQKVDSAPIVIVNHHAIAAWVHGEKGGRALLRRVQGKWEIMVCGGDGLMDLSTLIDAGIAKQTASGLVAQLNKAEQSISAERGRRFGLFGTTDLAQPSSVAVGARLLSL